MATRNYVPRANGEGSIGTKKKHWGGAFFDNLAVKTLEVIGGGAENDAQPATVGWVKQGFSKLLKSALEISGCRVVTERTGYICFGKFFGGLKIQWGTMTANGQYNAFPVAFETTARKVFFQTLVPPQMKLRICLWRLLVIVWTNSGQGCLRLRLSMVLQTHRKKQTGLQSVFKPRKEEI